MNSDARHNSGRDQGSIGRRKQRLARISRLDPISKAIFSSAAESETTSNAPPSETSWSETAGKAHLREIEHRLQNGTYSVPAEKLAPILARIFLTLRQQPSEAAKQPSGNREEPLFPDDPDRML
jgi:anti-sigma28 factor (negative regulator of flagellin synthesis)